MGGVSGETNVLSVLCFDKLDFNYCMHTTIAKLVAETLFLQRQHKYMWFSAVSAVLRATAGTAIARLSHRNSVRLSVQ